MASKQVGMGEISLPERGKRQGKRPGRGLLAELSQGRQQDPGAPIEVPLEDIADHPMNEPERIEDDKLEDLVASVRQVGILEPALLVPAELFLEHHPGDQAAVGGARWVSVTGHRRRAAARLAGLATVPGILREDLADASGDEVALHENNADARLGLTPLQEARRFADVMERRSLSQLKLAQHLGRPQGQISKRLALLALPPRMQELVAAEAVTVKDAGKVASALKNANDADGLAAELNKVIEEKSGEKLVASQALRVAEARVLARRVEQETQRVAKGEGLEVVAPEAVPDVQRLTDPDEIAAAKGRGDLAVTTGPAGPVYVRTSEPSLTQEQVEQRQKEHAAQTRQAFLPDLVGRLTGEEQTVLLAKAVTCGVDLGATVTASARELCRAAGVGRGANATMDPDTWRRQLPGTDPLTGAAIALVAIEHAATRDDSGPLAQWYLPWLTSHGYAPTDWERDSYSTE